MRIRTALVAAGVATAGLLAPASPAQAAPVPFVAVVNCDAASGTIKVGTAGATGYATGSEFTPNMPVTVEFQTLRTSWSTTTTDGTTPPGNKITVSATTDAKGGLTITGYTKPWRGKVVPVLRRDGPGHRPQRPGPVPHLPGRDLHA